MTYLCVTLKMQSMLEFDVANPAINLLPFVELINVLPQKCRLRDPGIAYDTTLARNVRDGLPRQTKHIVGLFSLVIDSIAWLTASGSWKIGGF